MFLNTTAIDFEQVFRATVRDNCEQIENLLFVVEARPSLQPETLGVFMMIHYPEQIVQGFVGFKQLRDSHGNELPQTESAEFNSGSAYRVEQVPGVIECRILHLGENRIEATITCHDDRALAFYDLLVREIEKRYSPASDLAPFHRILASRSVIGPKREELRCTGTAAQVGAHIWRYLRQQLPLEDPDLVALVNLADAYNQEATKLVNDLELWAGCAPKIAPDALEVPIVIALRGPRVCIAEISAHSMPYGSLLIAEQVTTTESADGKEAEQRAATSDQQFLGSVWERIKAELERQDMVIKPEVQPSTMGNVPSLLTQPSHRNAGDAGVGNWEPPVGNVFRRTGDYWEICYESRNAFLMKDLDGLGYIAILLQMPYRSTGVLKMIAVVKRHRSDPANQTDALEVGLDVSADATQAILDPQAFSELKERLSELAEERQRANQIGDEKALQKIEEEEDRIETELKRAKGLSGRKRNFATRQERARVEVQKRIRYALTKIESPDPILAKHLRSSIKTGSTCSYQPEGESPIWIT